MWDKFKSTRLKHIHTERLSYIQLKEEEREKEEQ